jgi:hypothetical protein
MMSPLVGSIDQYYNDYPEEYTILADDRDFVAQTAALLTAGPNFNGPWVELCAGAARHAAELSLAANVEVWAIDASAAMRSLALKLGFRPPDRYLLARLPHLDLPSALVDQFAGAFMLRYSAGYLTPLEIEALLDTLKPWLRHGARLVFELHDLNLVRGSLADLTIRTRRKTRADGTILSCVWPAGALHWKNNDWCVDMDVLVEVHSADGRLLEQRRYVSREHMHSLGDLERAAHRVGGYRILELPVISREAFPHSVLVGLERE